MHIARPDSRTCLPRSGLAAEARGRGAGGRGPWLVAWVDVDNIAFFLILFFYFILFLFPSFKIKKNGWVHHTLPQLPRPRAHSSATTLTTLAHTPAAAPPTPTTPTGDLLRSHRQSRTGYWFGSPRSMCGWCTDGRMYMGVCVGSVGFPGFARSLTILPSMCLYSIGRWFYMVGSVAKLLRIGTRSYTPCERNKIQLGWAGSLR